MKLLLTGSGLLLLFTGAAHADVKCQTQISSVGAETYVVAITAGRKNPVYSVTHYGHSRNTYSAEYTVGIGTTSRSGHTLRLKKIQDHSTWNDMPDTLFIQDSFDNAFTLNGLAEPVYFSATDCKDI